VIYGCHGCGRIFAPRNAPSRCMECDGALESMTIDAALDLARARQQRLRSRSALRAQPPAGDPPPWPMSG
jgi:hypothetical protein